jgi:hypothetical protein
MRREQGAQPGFCAASAACVTSMWALRTSQVVGPRVVGVNVRVVRLDNVLLREPTLDPRLDCHALDTPRLVQDVVRHVSTTFLRHDNGSGTGVRLRCSPTQRAWSTAADARRESSSEGAVQSGEIAEAIPLVELVVEELGVLDDLAGEQPVVSSSSIRCERSTFPLSRGRTDSQRRLDVYLLPA